MGYRRRKVSQSPRPSVRKSNQSGASLRGSKMKRFRRSVTVKSRSLAHAAKSDRSLSVKSPPKLLSTEPSNSGPTQGFQQTMRLPLNYSVPFDGGVSGNHPSRPRIQSMQNMGRPRQSVIRPSSYSGPSPAYKPRASFVVPPSAYPPRASFVAPPSAYPPRASFVAPPSAYPPRASFVAPPSAYPPRASFVAPPSAYPPRASFVAPRASFVAPRVSYASNTGYHQPGANYISPRQSFVVNPQPSFSGTPRGSYVIRRPSMVTPNYSRTSVVSPDSVSQMSQIPAYETKSSSSASASASAWSPQAKLPSIPPKPIEEPSTQATPPGTPRPMEDKPGYLPTIPSKTLNLPINSKNFGSIQSRYTQNFLSPIQTYPEAEKKPRPTPTSGFDFDNFGSSQESFDSNDNMSLLDSWVD